MTMECQLSGITDRIIDGQPGMMERDEPRKYHRTSGKKWKKRISFFYSLIVFAVYCLFLVFVLMK